jgi:hypothetical protein
MSFSCTPDVTNFNVYMSVQTLLTSTIMNVLKTNTSAKRHFEPPSDIRAIHRQPINPATRNKTQTPADPQPCHFLHAKPYHLRTAQSQRVEWRVSRQVRAAMHADRLRLSASLQPHVRRSTPTHVKSFDSQGIHAASYYFLNWIWICLHGAVHEAGETGKE